MLPFRTDRTFLDCSDTGLGCDDEAIAEADVAATADLEELVGGRGNTTVF